MIKYEQYFPISCSLASESGRMWSQNTRAARIRFLEKRLDELTFPHLCASSITLRINACLPLMTGKPGSLLGNSDDSDLS